MELRDISLDDLALFERLQCDPIMMAELGGPHPIEKMPQILQNTFNVVRDGQGWVYKVMVDGDRAVGSISLWEHAFNGKTVNEIGWMILPEFQGRGLASEAVRAVLDMARQDERWKVIHAYPATTNPPSNAICRKMGFALVEQCEYDYAGRMLTCNHWRINLSEN